MPQFSDVKMMSFNNIYAIDNNGKFQHLENDTFKIIYSFPSSLYFNNSKIEVTSSNNIYISCSTSPYFNYILKSNNSGVSWDTSYCSPSVHINNIHFLSDSIGFALCDSGIILKTSDAGNSWSSLTTCISKNVKDIDFMSSMIGIAVGDSGIVFKTVDCGNSWIQMVSPTYFNLTKVKFPENDSIVFIQTNTCIWKAKIDDIPVLGVKELFKNGTIFIYPNPVSGICNITVPDEFMHENNLTLSIFDNSGKMIQQKTLSMEEGKIKLDLEAEAKGIYNVTLTNGKKLYSGKIVFE